MSISLQDYLTASGRYPDRALHPEVTEELLHNVAKLLSAVRCLMQDLNYKAPLNVTSGFRPAKVNETVVGASKKSLHQQGLAVDILDDKQQSLARRIAERPDLLRLYGLFIEDPTNTRGANTNWVHLDLSPTRPDRPSRMFKP